MHTQGNVTMRVLKDMFESVLELGPMSQVRRGSLLWPLAWTLAAAVGSAGGQARRGGNLGEAKVKQHRRGWIHPQASPSPEGLRSLRPHLLVTLTPPPMHSLTCTHALSHPHPQMMSMIPGFNSDMMPKGNDKASQMVIKRFITIIESMTDKVGRRLVGWVVWISHALHATPGFMMITIIESMTDKVRPQPKSLSVGG